MFYINVPAGKSIKIVIPMQKVISIKMANALYAAQTILITSNLQNLFTRTNLYRRLYRRPVRRAAIHYINALAVKNIKIVIPMQKVINIKMANALYAAQTILITANLQNPFTRTILYRRLYLLPVLRADIPCAFAVVAKKNEIAKRRRSDMITSGQQLKTLLAKKRVLKLQDVLVAARLLLKK